jgi:beta-lactamase regulating signal transducer with metallopeptidase domain
MNEIFHALEGVLGYLFIGSVTALVLVPLALALLRVARIQRPVYRHVIWLYVLIGVVAIPGLWLHGPKIEVAVLPAATDRPVALVQRPPDSSGVKGSAAPGSIQTTISPVQQVPVADVQGPALSRKGLVAAAWLIGFTVMSLRLAVTWHRLHRICLSASPVPLVHCPATVTCQRVRLRLTSKVQGPVCLGVTRPTILLPTEMYHHGSAEDLRMVLTHELAHVQRRDGWLNLFQRIVEALFYFHPLVWLASRQLTNEREHICDNYVLAQGASPDNYTALLLAMVEQTLGARSIPGVALFEGQLLARVRSLLSPGRDRQTRLTWRSVALCTATAFAVLVVFGSIRLTAQAPKADGEAGPATVAGTDQPRTIDAVFERDNSSPTSIVLIRPPFTFTLKTVTLEGQPRPGVRIRCVHPRPERGRPLVELTATTDASGSAQITVTDANLLADRYVWFEVVDENVVGNGAVGISPIDHEFTWTFKTIPLQQRAFQVVDPKGKGIAAAKVWLAMINFPLDASPHACDPQGRVTLKCPQARLHVGAIAPGFASTVLREVDLSGASPTVIKLNQGQKIEGRVRDSKGRPVEGLVVLAKKQDSLHYLDEFILKTTTGKDGRYTLSNVSAGEWEVSARSADPNRPLFVTPVKRTVRTWWKATGVNLLALDGFRVKGRYVSQYDTRLKGEGGRRTILVSVHQVTQPGLIGFIQAARQPIKDCWWEERTNEDGTFDIWSLPSGAMGWISFTGISGFQEVVSVPQAYPFLRGGSEAIQFDSVPPGTYEGIEVRFSLAARIEGTVTDMAGHPVQGVEVAVLPSGNTMKVDEAGRFMGELPPHEEVKLVVRKASEPGVRRSRADTGLLVTDSFEVHEGEIVERHLVIPDDEPAGPASPQASDWRARFDQVYRLDEGQILKRIAPPFIPERGRYFGGDPKPDLIWFHWKDGLQFAGLGVFEPGTHASLGSALALVLRLKSYEYEGPEELLNLELPGDWILRDEAPAEAKLYALEQLLASQIGRAIRIESRSIQENAIVATGRYEYHALPEPFQAGLVTMYSDRPDPDEHLGGGTGMVHSVGEFLNELGDRVGIRVIDQTEPGRPGQIFFLRDSSSDLAHIKSLADKSAKLKMLLDNVSRQTGLQFKVEPRTVQKWFVTEATSTDRGN